ncbi:hypothetical protein NL108_018310 [Boleophthalmus pectinirostris]|nr:hypothetical protein NL108_018310 [Boleophthalmus pectinirostris]
MEETGGTVSVFFMSCRRIVRSVCSTHQHVQTNLRFHLFPKSQETKMRQSESEVKETQTFRSFQIHTNILDSVKREDDCYSSKSTVTLYCIIQVKVLLLYYSVTQQENLLLEQFVQIVNIAQCCPRLVMFNRRFS